MIRPIKALMQKCMMAVLISLIVLSNTSAVQAHFVDYYCHMNSVNVNSEGVIVYCIFCTGPIDAPIIWKEADTDGDGKVSSQESQKWLEKSAATMIGTLDSKTKLKWNIEDMIWPSSIDASASGDEDIYMTLKYAWPKKLSGAHKLTIEDKVEKKSCEVYFDAFNADVNNDEDLKAFNFTAENGKLAVDFEARPQESTADKPNTGTDKNTDASPGVSPEETAIETEGAKDNGIGLETETGNASAGNTDKNAVPSEAKGDTVKSPNLQQATPQPQAAVSGKSNNAAAGAGVNKGNQVDDKSYQQQKQGIKILTGMLNNGKNTPGFYILIFLVALLLGALHALTPGHGKSIAAAYLVGSNGTVRHAIILGSIITLTHTGSVIILSVVALTASHYFMPQEVFPVLELISGLLILILGIVLFRSRLHERAGGHHHNTHSHGGHTHVHSDDGGHTHAHSDDDGHAHTHSHDDDDHTHAHSDDDGHAHAHSHDDGHTHMHSHGRRGHTHSHEAILSGGVSMKSLLTLGISGGMIPCPDAIAVLLVAVALNRIFLGTMLIVTFSIGLALVLISIGIIIVKGRKLISKVEGFDTIAPVISILSALVVLVLGAVLTYKAAESFDLLSKLMQLISGLGNVIL